MVIILAYTRAEKFFSDHNSGFVGQVNVYDLSSKKRHCIFIL